MRTSRCRSNERASTSRRRRPGSRPGHVLRHSRREAGRRSRNVKPTPVTVLTPRQRRDARNQKGIRRAYKLGIALVASDRSFVERGAKIHCALDGMGDLGEHAVKTPRVRVVRSKCRWCRPSCATPFGIGRHSPASSISTSTCSRCRRRGTTTGVSGRSATVVKCPRTGRRWAAYGDRRLALAIDPAICSIRFLSWLHGMNVRHRGYQRNL